jgi:hypothetical protein
MTTPVKLGSFVAVLAAVFGLAYLTGTQSQALLAPAPTHSTEFGALSDTVDGYTLTPVRPTLKPGDDLFVEFRVTGPDGEPLPEADESNPSAAHPHLMAFRHDFTGFQHVYPEQGEGASWWALLNLSSGPWRIIVELRTAALGRDISLATDLSVTGAYQPAAPPSTADQAEAIGLTVTRTGTLTTSVNASTGAMITDHGTPVTDLQSAHDAVGHAVIIRPGDLGYRHLHSLPSSENGPRLDFVGGVPEQGRYVMFIEFFREDVLHVAAYTVEVVR